MPVAPSVWSENTPVTAHQLNADLYSYDGSGFGANGIQFHAHRPVLLETKITTSALSAASGGTWTVLSGAEGVAFSVLDTAALFGLGADSPGVFGQYQFAPSATASSGTPPAAGAVGTTIATSAGGWTLVSHFATAGAFSGTNCAVGAGWYLNGTRYSIGNVIKGNTGRDSCAFALDLVNVGSGATNTWAPGELLADPAGTANTPTVSTGGTSGETPRMLTVWCGVASGGTTVSALPAPQATWTEGTEITADLLNATIRDTLNLLNYPPMMQTAPALATSIPNATATAIPFGTGGLNIDNYSGLNGSTDEYVVQIPGLYLVHANVLWSENATGQRSVGLWINGSNGHTFYGPNYPAIPIAGIPTGTSITRIFDLEAGDTVQVFGYQTSGGNLTLASPYVSRFLMVWMGALATSATPLTWTPPDTTYRWQAGAAAGTLPALFQQYIGNDLNFLVNRPYLLSRQTVAQTGLTNNAWNAVTMDTVGGQIHGTPGDNYGGWNTSAHQYVAQVPGWYLVVSEVSAATPSSGSPSITAGIGCSSSGGIVPGTTPDWYEHKYVNLAGGPPGATAVGLYYLLPEEAVWPEIQFQDWPSTPATGTSGFTPHFECVWICE